jgi:hypothetical protein
MKKLMVMAILLAAVLAGCVWGRPRSMEIDIRGHGDRHEQGHGDQGRGHGDHSDEGHHGDSH